MLVFYRQTDILGRGRRFNSIFDSKHNLKTYITQFTKAKEAMDKLEVKFEVKQKRVDKAIENMDKKREEQEDQTIILDITDDMYCGALSSEVVQEFTCMLCYGIVIDPIKCKTCSNLVCKKCVNMKKVEQNQQECYKKCGSR